MSDIDPLAVERQDPRRLSTLAMRVAQRERPWCWFCDPDVPSETKLEARRKRTQRVLADIDLSTPMSRRHAREALALAVLDEHVKAERAGVVRALIADQGREDEL